MIFAFLENEQETPQNMIEILLKMSSKVKLKMTDTQDDMRRDRTTSESYLGNC